jgi:hypothetical protein
MATNGPSVEAIVPTGLMLAPIHALTEATPLSVCVFVKPARDELTGTFVLLQELPGARVYLGAICDAKGRPQECVEIWVQALELKDFALSGQPNRLTNYDFDQRWHAETEMWRANRPAALILTGMEDQARSPVLIKRSARPDCPALAATETTGWRLCKEDALLERFGLKPYTTSPFRYLYEPQGAEPRTFLATAPGIPVNAHVQGLERLTEQGEAKIVFNPYGGFVRVMRFLPLGFRDYADILEGRPWLGVGGGAAPLFQNTIYGELQAWSSSPKSVPFLLYGATQRAERLNEVFFLKLSLLHELFKEVHGYVRAQQLPLLNVTPSSFHVRLPSAGDQFPVLWSARCELTNPGQAHPLKIRLTEQKYFIRLGKTEPSPFLPEGLGAHSSGIGRVQMRGVRMDADGVVLEITLVAENELVLEPHDILWFKLPLSEEYQRLEFYAHVYSSTEGGTREAQFRTVPAKLDDSLMGMLKRTEGTTFQRAPYAIWPLLSSPCDMHSLGIVAIRILLANSRSNFPIVVDEVLRLARSLGKSPDDADRPLPNLKSLIERDAKVRELLSPRSLVDSDQSSDAAWSQIQRDLWLGALTVLLRLFPGHGAQSYCKSFGDVSPHAIETVFDRPIQELETLVACLRSWLLPSISSNEEIAEVLLEQLAPDKGV